MSVFKLPSVVQELKSDFLNEKQVRLFIKRDDLIHEKISGNKWRKLKYNIQEAVEAKHTRLLTFGGAFSNHIVATAVAGKINGLETIGVIRGEEVIPLNSTLSECRKHNMTLKFISRSLYRQKEEQAFLNRLNQEYGPFYHIPEGGNNLAGVKGCEEILDEVNIETDVVCVAAGTGTTATGLLKSMEGGRLIVYPALKGGSFLKEAILSGCCHKEQVELVVPLQYHFGGYARVSDELVQFVNSFYKTYTIKLDLIYTAKMMYGLMDMIKKDQFSAGTKILAIHTGGLQGNAGFTRRKGINLFE